MSGTAPEKTPSFGRSTAVMAAGTLVSRVTGFGRLVALAYALGFTRVTDTYNLANVTPNIVYELVLGGVLSATLLPVFVERLAGDDEEEAWRGISAVVTLAGAVMLAITVLFVLAAPLLIKLYTLGNDSPSAGDQQVVATGLLRLFAPQLAFYGIVTLSTALLRARRRFAAPMFAPVLNNLVVIGVLLAVPHVIDDLSLEGLRRQSGGVLLLGLGTTAGVAGMALVQVVALRRSRPKLSLVWAPGHETVRRIVRLSGWTLAFVAANQVALWTVLVLANGRQGDVAAYQAAQVFFLLPHGIVAVSIITALQNDLAERWQERRRPEFAARVSFGLRTIAAVAVPAAVGYLCLARPIVEIALEHGALSSASSRTTASVLTLLVIGLPGFSCYLFLMSAYQSMQDTRSIFLLYVGENGANIVLALALYPSLGVRVLALAFALAYTAGTALAVAHLRRRLDGQLDLTDVTRSWARVAVASAAMAAAVLGLRALLGPALLEVGAGVAGGGLVYLLAARALGMPELRALLRSRGRPGMN